MITTLAKSRLRRVLPALGVLTAAMAAIYGAIVSAPSRGVVVKEEPLRQSTAEKTHEEFVGAFDQGLAAFKRGDAHGAAVAFDKAAQINPASSDARVNLGFALVELNAWDAARDNFERALAINPQQFNAYYGIAEVLEAQGAIDQAAGAMNTFLYYARPDDPFRRRAEAALWEWGRAPEAVGAGPAPDIASAQSAHDVSVRDLDGEPFSFAAYKGKVLVLNLWASWCPPCRRELPALGKLSQRLDPDAFAVVGLSVDSDPDLVREYLRRIGVDFPNLWDKDLSAARGYFGVKVYPTTYIIAPDGNVVRRAVGYRNWASEGVIADIKALGRK